MSLYLLISCCILINISFRKNEQVLWQYQACPVKIEPPCVEPKVCVPRKKQMCAKKKSKDDDKKWSLPTT